MPELVKTARCDFNFSEHTKTGVANIRNVAFHNITSCMVYWQTPMEQEQEQEQEQEVANIFE